MVSVMLQMGQQVGRCKTDLLFARLGPLLEGLEFAVEVGLFGLCLVALLEHGAELLLLGLELLLDLGRRLLLVLAGLVEGLLHRRHLARLLLQVSKLGLDLCKHATVHHHTQLQ